ncbi:unnamed protein product [Cuscuta campestris]|uniref:Uncharacterized protein n=1 Tax=Cuscuta campestris TaxID=132261 RepID=A0A484MAH5_9ASTE|nr:unnamed protein product [Cuscuta campestris]
MPRCENASSRQESAAEEGERPWRREGSKYIHIQTGLAFNTGASAERFHNTFLTKEIVSPKIVNKDLFKSATYAPSKSLFSQQDLTRDTQVPVKKTCFITEAKFSWIVYREQGDAAPNLDLIVADEEKSQNETQAESSRAGGSRATERVTRSWYEPPYCRDYTLCAEEQIEANKVAIRERAKLLESVRKEKEFKRRLCEGSDMIQKMLDDFQRERLEAEAKADELVNDLCKAIELKRSLQSQDQMREVNAQNEALEPKTNPKPFNHQVPVLEDSPSFSPSQKPESITTLARATVVMLPECPPSQVSTSIVVQEVEPTEGPDSEPPRFIQEKKEEEVLPMAINDHLLNFVEGTPPEEPVLEEIEPITWPQDTNVQESEQESTCEEILYIERRLRL